MVTVRARLRPFALGYAQDKSSTSRLGRLSPGAPGEGRESGVASPWNGQSEVRTLTQRRDVRDRSYAREHN